MNAKRKTVLLTVALLCTAVFAVFAAALVWIQSDAGLAWVRTQIDRRIAGRIAIQSVRLSPLAQRLALVDVVLYDEKEAPLAGFSRLSVRLDGWALLHREIHLASVALVDPWANLVVDEGGNLNIVGALASPIGGAKPDSTDPAPGPPFNLVLETGGMTGGRFTYEDKAGKNRIETAGVALTASGNLLDRTGDLTLTIAHAGLENEAVGLKPARIGLGTKLDGESLTISDLRITSEQLSLHLSGNAHDLTAIPVLDGRLFLETNLSQVKKMLGLVDTYDGAVSTALTVKGRADDPEAGLTLRFDGGTIAGQPLDTSRFAFTLADRQVTVDEATVGLAGGHVRLGGGIDLTRAFPSGFFTPPENVNAIAYDLTLTSSIPDLSPWLKGFAAIGGSFSGQLKIEGAGIDPSKMNTRLTASASGKDLSAPGLERTVQGRIQLYARADRGDVVLSGLDLTADGAHLTGDGRFHTRNREVAGNLALTATDLQRVLAVVGRPDIRGSCHGDVTVGGSLQRPQLVLNMTAQDLASGTFVFGDLAAHVRMDEEGVIDLSDLTLKNRNTRVQGNARLRWRPGEGGIDDRFDNHLDLTLESVSAADFVADAPVSGTMDGRLQLSGPLLSLAGDLSLSATALATDAVTIGNVAGHMALKEGTVGVDRLRLTNQDSVITASGRVRIIDPETARWTMNPAFDFDLQSDHMNPGHFVHGIQGDVTAKGDVQGTMDDPMGSLQISGKGIDLAGQPLQDLSMEMHVAGRRLYLDRLFLSVAPDQQLTASGWIDREKVLDLTVQADGIAISAIESLKARFPGEGTLALDATAHGTLGNPDIDGRLTVSDLIVHDQPMADFTLTARLHERKLHVDGDLDFSVMADCDLENLDFDAQLAFDRTETAPFFGAVGKPEIHGTLTGRMAAKGNLRDPAQLSAEVELYNLRLLFKDAPLISSERISVRMADRKLSIVDADLAILSEGNLHLEGEALWDGPVDIVIHGRIPLAAAGTLTDELAGATGILILAGEMSGRMERPHVDATLQLEEVGMTIPALNQKLHDLNGRIHLTDNRLDVDHLSGMLDTGRFSINGGLSHNNFTPASVDLTASTTALPLEVPDTLSMLLNGNVQLTGRNRSAEIKGEIVLLEGVYYKDVKISLLKVASSATSRQRTVAAASTPISIPFFDTVRLNITIGHRQPFAVDNNLAALEISPDLTIGGTLAKPVINGRAQVREGTVSFQKKTFDVKKGVIDFINPYRTEADIDIQSETTIRDWTITLAIKGTPDNLDFSLSSVPAETDSDILSLILFGRTAKELSQGEGGSKRTTAQIMAEMIADTFGDDIKRKTGVDILQVETNGADDEDEGSVKVTVGKHLSDRMTVKYAVETKDGEVTQRAISEYKLLEHILVNGFQDSKGIYGSELVYRIEFR